MRTLVSLESLLVRDVAAGGRYIGAATFETESIGFGSPNNRTIMSSVYLGRTCERVQPVTKPGFSAGAEETSEANLEECPIQISPKKDGAGLGKDVSASPPGHPLSARPAHLRRTPRGGR